MRALLALMAALTALAVMAPRAEAGWKVDRALMIAGFVWHHPCDDEIQLRFTAEDEVAWTAAETPCTVFLGANAPHAWRPFCHAVLHEVGHLAGAEHSRNPRSVMYPYIDEDSLLTRHGVRWPGIDWRCRKRGMSYLSSRVLEG